MSITTTVPEAPQPGGTTQPGGSARSDRNGQRRSRSVRLAVLVASIAIITALGLLHQYSDIKIVGVDALCPFGGIETLWTLISSGVLVKQIAASSVILLGVVLVVAVVFRRSFCGYICPLGALQELFGKIGKAIWPRKRPQVPAAIDRPARYLKYAILAVFAVWSWQAAALVIRPYDPWVAWMHLSSAEVFAEFTVGLVVLGVSLDPPETAGQIQPFVRSRNLTYPIAHDVNSQIANLYNKKGSAPYQVLIGRSGNVIKRRDSYQPGDEVGMEQEIVAALG